MWFYLIAAILNFGLFIFDYNVDKDLFTALWLFLAVLCTGKFVHEVYKKQKNKQKNKENYIGYHRNNNDDIVIGDTVEFYDYFRAKEDDNHSGSKKYYSTGKVICRRLTKKFALDDGTYLGDDDVVDIELSDGRVSRGHFTNGVKKI